MGGKELYDPGICLFQNNWKLGFSLITNWKLGYFPVLPTEKWVFPEPTQACSSYNNTWLWHCPPEPSCNWNQDILSTPNFPKPSKNWQEYCSREVSRPEMFGSGDHALKRLIKVKFFTDKSRTWSRISRLYVWLFVTRLLQSLIWVLFIKFLQY